MIEDEQIDRLEKLASGATVGEWFAAPDGQNKGYRVFAGERIAPGSVEFGWDVTTPKLDERDARYIAAANPETVRSLISEVRYHRQFKSVRDALISTLDDQQRFYESCLTKCPHHEKDETVDMANAILADFELRKKAK